MIASCHHNDRAFFHVTCYAFQREQRGGSLFQNEEKKEVHFSDGASDNKTVKRLMFLRGGKE